MFKNSVGLNDYVNRDALEIIFSFLPIADKFRLQRVCQYWKKLLRRLLDRQKAIVFRGNLRSCECRYDDDICDDRDDLGPIFMGNTTSVVEIKRDALASILSQCPKVKIVQLVDVTIDSEALITIADLCGQLECLNLFLLQTFDKTESLDLALKRIASASGDNLRHLYLRAMTRKFTEETLRDIFKSCPKLEVVDVDNSIVTFSDVSLPHLSNSVVRFSGAFCGVRLRDNAYLDSGLQESGITSLCSGFGVHLQELKLSSISDPMLEIICRNLTNLLSLELFWDERDPTPHNCHMIGFLSNLTRLTLRVKDEDADFFDRDILKILQGCPKLQVLILGLPVGDGCLAKIPQYCPDVDSLALIFEKNPKLISDESVFAFAKLRNLKVFDVWESSCSNKACITLIKCCEKLNYLAFRACRNVSNPTLYAFIKKAHKQKNMNFKFCYGGTRIILSSHDFHIIPENLKVKQFYRWLR